MTGHPPPPRTIPAAVKREVRRRCGFGCVICGKPVFEYHHMDQWSEVQEHEADNIILLCPDHHTAATARRLSREVQDRYAAAPVNIGRDLTAGSERLWYGEEPFFYGGGNWIRGFGKSAFEDTSFRFGGHVEDGFFLLDVGYKDRFGNIVLLIEQGEMTVSMWHWDIIYEGTMLTFRDEARSVRLMVDFRASEDIVELVRVLADKPPDETDAFWAQVEGRESPPDRWLLVQDPHGVLLSSGRIPAVPPRNRIKPTRSLPKGEDPMWPDS